MKCKKEKDDEEYTMTTFIFPVPYLRVSTVNLQRFYVLYTRHQAHHDKYRERVRK